MILSQIPQDRSEEVRAVFQSLFGEIPHSLSLLTGGYSSSLNFKCEVKEEAYVLRIMGLDQPLEDRRQQLRCLRLASQAGIAPHVLHVDPDAGLVVMDYIAQEQLQQCPSWPEKMAKTLKKLHGFGDAFEEPYQPLFPYMQALQKRLQDFSPSAFLQAYLLRIEEIQHLLSKHRIVTACHNDLNTNNLLFDGDQIYFIDFEMAGLEDPYFDLAMLCAQMMEESTQDASLEQERFLKAYFGKVLTVEQNAKIMLMKQVAFCWPAIHFFDFAAQAGLSLANEEMITKGPSLKAWAKAYASGEYTLQNPADFLLYAAALVQESTRQIASSQFEAAYKILS